MGVTNTITTVHRLLVAKKKANNEFYTPYCTVERIVEEYKDDLKGKIIYCNCDLEWSNFVRYFKDNKDVIQYKEFYHTGLTDEFVFGDYCVGDFRNQNSIELLQKCDIVITNPPFSLIGEWYDLVKKYDKKFIVMCPNTFTSRKQVRLDFINKKIFINLPTLSGYSRKYTTPTGEIKAIKTFVCTNIKKIDYNYKDTSQKCLIKDCNYRYYDNTNILAITNGERIPEDYNGLFTLSINQLWHFNFKKYDLICFANDYKHKLFIDSKEQFVRILCRRIK